MVFTLMFNFFTRFVVNSMQCMYKTYTSKCKDVHVGFIVLAMREILE